MRSFILDSNIYQALLRMEKSFFSQLLKFKNVLILVFLVNTSAKAQEVLPYFHSLESENNTPLPFIKLLNTQKGSNAATFSNEGIYLLPYSDNQSEMQNLLGAILLNNIQIEANKSFEVGFDYSIFGGNGAEGFTFFLIDANDNIHDISAGADGPNLGYTPNRANDLKAQYREPALTRGVLAVGFDVRGNFKDVIFSEDGSHRRHGFAAPKGGWAKGANGIDSYITVRSSYADLLTNEDVRNKGYIGFYTYLTKSTLATAAKNGSGTQSAYSLNYSYGMSENFNIRSNVFTTIPGALGYRSAVFKFETDPLNRLKVKVSLKIRYDDQNFVPVFEDYILVSKSMINNAAAQGGDYNDNNIQKTETSFFSQKTPVHYRIGFTAASGNYSDAIIIRNLVVRYLGTAEAYNITTQGMATIPITIDPYENAFGYFGTALKKIQKTNSRDIFDNTAFRFIRSDNNESTEYNSPEGLWKFNINTGIITFTPIDGFQGIAKIRYRIKAVTTYQGSYNIYSSDAYYSAPAEIQVEVMSNYAPTNPQARTKLQKK